MADGGLLSWAGLRGVISLASAAGLARLEELAAGGATHAPPGVVDELRRLALDAHSGAGAALAGRDGEESPSAAFRRLRREMTSAERAALIRQRDERTIDDAVLRTLLRRLDLEEAMLASEEWDTDPP